MAAEIIQQRLNQLSNARDQDEFKQMLGAIIDGIRVVTAKLDGDATVTLTDYTSAFDAVVTKS